MEIEEVTTIASFQKKRYRLFKTFTMMLVWLSFACCSSIVGPTIIDLTEKVNCDYEEITRAMIGRSVGMLLGSLIGGTLTDKYRKYIDLLMSVKLFFMGFSTLMTPLVPNLPLIGVAFFVEGLSQLALSASANTMVMMLWGAETNARLQALYAIYGIGTTVTPLMTQPFLSKEYPGHAIHNQSQELNFLPGENPNEVYISATGFENTSQRTLSEIENEYFGSNHSISFKTESRIYIPYAISGCFSILSSIVFFLYYLKGLPPYLLDEDTKKSNRPLKELFSPRACAGDKIHFGMFMLFTVISLYILNSGRDNVFFVLLVPYSVNELHFTKEMAVYINTVYMGCFALGRVIASVLGIWCPVQIMLFFEVIGSSLGLLLLTFIGAYNQTWYWISIAIFSLFLGPIVAHVMLWLDRYIKVTALGVAGIDIGIGVGAMLFPWLGGYIYEYGNKYDTLYISSALTLIMLLHLVIAQIVTSFYGDRYKNQEIENSENGERNKSNDGEHTDENTSWLK